ncbi:ribosomal protein S18-alanine N-acetyltransferase [Symplocastrum sp. BBK-W-15]|uniref:Ribosomal protein S18-alanine N-acetyltransferase n=1 Tax=Limnofasciculus baicalensis BBK-W-15 TaxID=2699891 RepID=A0AAE3KPK4_9CYAN|nr:ribosomal protein S18-alanine N-acetyltransferase [Limnofasciculus baicalensis BBK-W-15]
MNLLQLNPLSVEQLNAAVELDRLCFGGLWTRDGYQRELESPNSHLIVLETVPGDRVSGCPNQLSDGLTQNSVKESLTTNPTSPNILLGLGCFWSILEEAHITILAVHPNYQRQGLGKLLLYALLRDARMRNLEWATLEVKPSNQAALSLYHKFGFTEAGCRRKYYQDTGEDALILWRGGISKPEFEETLSNCFQEVEHRLARWGWKL